MTGDLLFFAIFFLFVTGAVIAAGYFLLLRPAAARASAGQTEIGAAEAEPASTKEAVARALQSLGEALPASPAEIESARRHLTAAGYRWPSSVEVYYGIKAAITVIAALVVGWIGYVVQDSILSAALAGLAAGAFGYKLLDRVLFALIRMRAGRIRRAMPAALDLMVLSLEAGQSLDQALQSTAHEFEHVYPDLAEELALTNFELQLGKSRTDALRRMAERNQETELRKLVKLLTETERFGTPLAPVLRNHARYLRIRVRQQAQEAARKVAVKLVFPVFFLIFPSVLIVTLGPAVLQLMEQLRVLMGV